MTWNASAPTVMAPRACPCGGVLWPAPHYAGLWQCQKCLTYVLLTPAITSTAGTAAAQTAPPLAAPTGGVAAIDGTKDPKFTTYRPGKGECCLCSVRALHTHQLEIVDW